MTGRWVRWAGVAGMVGGVLWIAATVLHASRPVGCVAEECARRAMRESSATEGVLTLAAFLLFALAATALVVLVRRVGRFGRGGRIGAVLAAGGVVVIVVASLVQTFLYDGDFPLMPYFVIPGIVALLVGVIVLAATVLRSGVLPRWASVSLLVGAVAMLGFNEQTHAAWLAIPFGLAWIAVGYAMWSRPVSGRSPGSASP